MVAWLKTFSIILQWLHTLWFFRQKKSISGCFLLLRSIPPRPHQRWYWEYELHLLIHLQGSREGQAGQGQVTKTIPHPHANAEGKP